ncbi:MAG: hypothetical protein GW904_02935 [Candidatus Altiarchaeum hamiconexum]|uniref:Uncharacterized protein n=1 Tax=Candidatus Altarchaeum hamiconexum TaxID=1803513 RepID=A0A8J8CFC2_9ARCH|nr:hypothetical protein [Candidatus Altarchaeum hamiconexum]PIX48408.1 MAG: hypothetical protein COZ53_04145 [Candidatus Altarchaeum sp. CG_4_8_14_3_um_filter_33_2054]PIZ32883.1 MAG: hypothetical protein COY41_00490 [Candidatus Altarchaeum sp. CG_4_10_14_0_8_um_filter_32_851]PJC15924.1 MAG: hypothetical protein CO063_00305 [Candidatus Altarchaeum sp. CG_4_9_14_0_8_um_filter_32_206]NCN68684.1 hypothetical protein [Candidatus Altarchaeum hamiconexum]
MKENMYTLKMDEEAEVNQQVNVKFETWVGEALVLRGSNLDAILTDTKRMYPDKAVIIKRAAVSKDS